MVWIKGLRCGVDNCNSRFYRVLSGRRVCQNNHIQEGLETAGDDDDFVAVGQRIRRPRTKKLQRSKHSESKTLRGLEARKMVLELMQTVFQHQIRFFKHQREVPHNFEQICRDLWARFLQMHRARKFGQTHLVVLLYLSCRRVNVPVMVSDFNLWIHSSQLPYFETYRLLDASKFLQLPPDLRRLFMPSTSRQRLYLHELANQLQTELEKHYSHLNFGELNVNYVCFRTCQILFFPPQVYVAAKRIFECAAIPSTGRRGWALIEELCVVCSVLVAAKFYLGLDDRTPELSSATQGHGFDWRVWHDMMLKIWIMRPDFGDAEEKLVHLWSGDQLDDYLAWYAKHMLSGITIDKRLSNFFPLPKIGATEPETYADANTLMELCSLLNSTSEPPVKSEPELKAEPLGCHYPSYSGNHESVGEIPQHLALILEVLERFFNADELMLRQALEQFETRIKRNYKKLLAGKILLD